MNVNLQSMMSAQKGRLPGTQRHNAPWEFAQDHTLQWKQSCWGRHQIPEPLAGNPISLPSCWLC